MKQRSNNHPWRGILTRSLFGPSVVVLVLLLAACDSPTAPSLANDPLSEDLREQTLGLQPRINVVRVAGFAQFGAPGQTLPEPFVVRVTDPRGSPLVGAPVSWKLLEGDGELHQSASRVERQSGRIISTMTDSNGRASAYLTLGPTLGRHVVEVSVGYSRPVRFQVDSRVT